MATRTIGSRRLRAETRAAERRRVLAQHVYHQRRAREPGPWALRAAGVGLVVLAVTLANRPWPLAAVLPPPPARLAPDAAAPKPLGLECAGTDAAFRWRWDGEPVAWTVLVFDDELREVARLGPTAPGATQLEVAPDLLRRLRQRPADAGPWAWMVEEAADAAEASARRSRLVVLDGAGVAGIDGGR